jgi:hypothetical protein
MGKKNKDDDDRHFHDFVLVQTVVSYRRGQRFETRYYRRSCGITRTE